MFSEIDRERIITIGQSKCPIGHLEQGWPVGEMSKSSSFILHLHNMQAVKLISTPLWWMAARLARALGGTAVAAPAILHWNVSLRQTVKKQTAAIAEGFVHESRLQERQRIGLDLHDILHQEFTGVSMLRVRMMR